MTHERKEHELNPYQKRNLLATCQYADRLLSDIEAMANPKCSDSLFPKYMETLDPGRAKTILDDVARIRALLHRLLEEEGVKIPVPDLDPLHGIKVALTYIKIGFEECTPKRMKGYGEVPDNQIRALNNLVKEVDDAANRLEQHLK